MDNKEMYHTIQSGQYVPEPLFTHSSEINEIAKALSKFRQSVGVIDKSSKNPFFKSDYAALPEIIKGIDAPLEESGLSYVQFPTGLGGLTTMLTHGESGQWMKGTYYMKSTSSKAQEFGSIITYQRRYALGAILGLNIDKDDDGNTGSKAPAKKVFDMKTYKTSTATIEAYIAKGYSGKQISNNILQKFSSITPDVQKELSKIKTNGQVTEALS